MDVRVEMYRILLGCINGPDLTMHFSFSFFGFDNERTVLVRDLVLLSQFNFVEFLGCRN